jgi:hypothetical protein
MSHHYHVYQFFPDDTSERILSYATAEEAVVCAKSRTQYPAALIGIIRRIIITDDGDHTCFEWQHGRGVTFPLRASQGNNQ